LSSLRHSEARSRGSTLLEMMLNTTGNPVRERVRNQRRMSNRIKTSHSVYLVVHTSVRMQLHHNLLELRHPRFCCVHRQTAVRYANAQSGARAFVERLRVDMARAGASPSIQFCSMTQSPVCVPCSMSAAAALPCVDLSYVLSILADSAHPALPQRY
jgi:hypothetical protein